MKQLYSVLLLTVLFFLGSCQNEDGVMDDFGYLRLSINADKSTMTKAGEEVYNPKQLAVKIVNKSGVTVEETDDYTQWNKKVFTLPVGEYTIHASSHGFDGKEAGWDKAYYVGADTVVIKKGESISSEFACTLANVLVTLEFDEAFKRAFKSATVVVKDTTNAANVLTFKMNDNTEKGKAYFPVTGLFAEIAATNQKDKVNSKTDTIKNVKAQENVRLIYHLAESNTGSTDIKIDLDGSTKTYTYLIGVPTQASNVITVSEANAWSNFAYLEGTASLKGVLDKSKLAFEYKLKDAEAWTKVPTLEQDAPESKRFTTKVTGLTPTKEYEYRLVYGEGEEAIVSDTVSFTTEGATALYNGNFDLWNQNGKIWYAGTADEANSKNSFWDSGNPGSASFNISPTNPEETIVHTAGGKAVALTSKSVPLVGFAAGNIYTGHFNGLAGAGAKLNFGQPFTARPTQLHGWFHYLPGEINKVKGEQPVKVGDTDICSIYIALSKKDTCYMLNTKEGVLFNPQDEDIIAYGELPLEQCKQTGDWTEFTINLEYRDLISKATHIIIVASASKYGDYFTGSTSSVMYLDDFELVYGDTPKEAEKK